MTTGTSTLTQKGQVTVPRRIRSAMRLRPGDIVVFDVVRGGVRVRKIPAGGLAQFCRDHPLPGADSLAQVRALREEWD